MRAVLSVLLVAITATTLQGQRIAPDRFVSARAVRPGGTGQHVVTPIPRNEPEAAPKLGGQVLAGLGGMALGLFAGGSLASLGQTSDGLAGVAEVAIAALGGAALGSAIGVQWHGKRHGMRSPFLPTFGGALLGMLPLPIAPLTSPLGAALGYNRYRQQRVEP
jgi:hypothetical protein